MKLTGTVIKLSIVALVLLLFGFPPARGVLQGTGALVDGLGTSTQAGTKFVFGFLAGGKHSVVADPDAAASEAAERIAAAPWASAAGTKAAPSARSPWRAAKAQPGPASRLSQVSCSTSAGGPEAPSTSSSRTQSANFMAPPL